MKNKTITYNIISLMLILLAGIIRPIFGSYLSVNVLKAFLYCAAGFIWLIQLNRRIVHHALKRHLIIVALLLVFWVLLKTTKYCFTVSGSNFGRYLWYAYYIPLHLIAASLFLSVLYIGIESEKKINSKWQLIWLPTIFLVGLILTNDSHQLVFYFNQGLSNWNEGGYSYGLGFYVISAYLAVIVLVMFIILKNRCQVLENRRRIWLPFSPLIVVIIYTIIMIVWPNNLLQTMWPAPEMMMVVTAFFVELLILVHLFPSNDRYAEFFRLSSLGIGMMKNDQKQYYVSKNMPQSIFRNMHIEQSNSKGFRMGDYVVKVKKITGGLGFWSQNLAEIHRLNTAIADQGDILREENELLKYENELKAERIAIEQKNHLYGTIAHRVKRQLNAIESIVINPKEDETSFVEQMKYAAIMNTYVKRYANLYLMYHSQKRVSGRELGLSIAETLEYLRFAGIRAHGEYQTSAMYLGDQLLIAYEILEYAIECSMPTLSAVLVTLKEHQDVLRLSIQLGTPEALLPENFLNQQLKAKAVLLKVRFEDETAYIDVTCKSEGI